LTDRRLVVSPGIDIDKTSFHLVGLDGDRAARHTIPGKPALEVQATRRLPRLLAGFATDPSIVLLGRETIYRDGKRVGSLHKWWLRRGPENGVDRDQVLSGR